MDAVLGATGELDGTSLVESMTMAESGGKVSNWDWKGIFYGDRKIEIKSKKMENKENNGKFGIICDFLRYLRMHTISYKNHDENKRFENKWKTKKSNKLPNIVFVYSFCCLN